MSLASGFNTEFQVIAAFLIFVIGYLALLLAAIACIAVAIPTYRGARWLYNYALNSFALRVGESRVLQAARLIPCTVETLSERIAVPRRSSL